MVIGLFAVPLVSMAQTDVFDAPGVFTYTIPANVTQIKVELWGAGGGGGSNRSFLSFPSAITCGGGGGGGGEYTNATIDVIPGQVYAILVGTGGDGGFNGNSGSQGSRSQINLNGITNPVLQSAFGGFGGGTPSDSNCFAGGGAGGSGSGGANATHTAGGNGGNGNSTSGGPGGLGFRGMGNGGIGSDDENSNAQDGASGRVEITTVAVNPPPTTANDNYSMAQDTVLFIAAPGVLSNDSSPAGTPLTAVLGTNPANGILALNADGSFFYTPNNGFVGIDTFTYRANNATGSISTSTVSITVTPSGTSAPSVKAQLVPAIIRVGDTVNIDIALENPFLAAGGGIDALETRCSFAPGGILSGLTATSSTELFKPDPVIVNKVQTGENLLYAVSQSGTNPLVTSNGKIFTIRVNAQKVGQATLNCTAKAIDGTGKEITLPFIGVVVDVQNLATGTGNIRGVVHFSHKPDGGATITLLNAAQTVIATTTTQADGSFIMTGVAVGTYTIRAESPGYLYAQGTVLVTNQQTVTKATVRLLAGDLVTSTPVVIDELDVVQLALNYGQTVPPASPASDLNADNVVGLADLNALAENLRKTGPIAWN